MATLVAGAGLVGDRPVMWVTRFEFVVNPQSAKVFGIDGSGASIQRPPDFRT
jgi:hypothetical protein